MKTMPKEMKLWWEPFLARWNELSGKRLFGEESTVLERREIDMMRKVISALSEDFLE